MQSDKVNGIDLAGTERLVGSIDGLVREALELASKRTDGGKRIDDEQVQTERLAYAATEVAAARDLVAYARGAAAGGQGDPVVDAMAGLFAAEVAQRLAAQIDAHLEEFGLSADRLNATLGSAEVKQLVRAASADAVVRGIGRHVVEHRGANNSWIDNDIALMTRDSVRQFAET